jgi:predicted secreted protein
MIVKGRDVLFTVNDGGTMKPICCARTASITTSADIGETSTLATGKWKTFKGLKMSYNLSAAGLVSFDMNYSIAVLRQQQVLLLPLNFDFFGTDDLGNYERYTGSFIITTINTPSTYNANFEYSMDGQGTGVLNIILARINIINAILASESAYIDVGDGFGNPLLYN